MSLEPVAHRDRIDRMSERITHRGPDSCGKFELPYLALAIRRLRIIDLETGDQPLSNEAGDVTLVFNGEIYNYRELRQGLIDRGHIFRTHSDGEVAVHLYEELGPGFVHELNGMFAIALWDDRARRLVLARDRAGEKPLYYRLRDRTLVFGSEIKSLFEYPGISREIDRDALAQYFLYGYFPTPRSVFAEIQKLPAGHMLIAENGETKIDHYWQLRDFLRQPGLSRPSRIEENQIIEDLRTRLREAAISRLVSDVPLGVFLSGGVDSSTLVALMSELTPGNVNTFSVAFSEKGFNEEPFAHVVANRFKTRHHVLRVAEHDLREGLSGLSNHLDEPIADPAVIPTFLLSRFARREIKVALSGEGSDELFGGYPTHLGVRLADSYLRLPGVLRHHFIERLGNLLPVSSGAVPAGMLTRRFLKHAGRNPAERHQIWFGMFAPVEIDRLLAPEWKGMVASNERLFAPLATLLEGAGFDETLAQMLYLDFGMYLQDNLLVKIDRASMACSLELRTPFLDHRLVEFAAALPASLKVRGMKLKYILKRAVEKWLPREIVYRRKRGFSVPISKWMRNELRPLVDETLAAEKLARQGIFNASYVRHLLDEHWAGRADHRKPLWTLLSFQLWFDRWGPQA